MLTRVEFQGVFVQKQGTAKTASVKITRSQHMVDQCRPTKTTVQYRYLRGNSSRSYALPIGREGMHNLEVHHRFSAFMSVRTVGA